MAPLLNDDVCVAATVDVVAAVAPALVEELVEELVELLVELLVVGIELDDEVAVALLPPKGVGPPFVGDVRTVFL